MPRIDNISMNGEHEVQLMVKQTDGKFNELKVV